MTNEVKQDFPEDKIIDLSDLVGESFLIKVGDKEYVVSQPDVQTLFKLEELKNRIKTADRNDVKNVFNLLIDQLLVVLQTENEVSKEELMSIKGASKVIPAMVEAITKRIFQSGEKDFLEQPDKQVEMVEKINQEVEKTTENLKSSESESSLE